MSHHHGTSGERRSSGETPDRSDAHDGEHGGAQREQATSKHPKPGLRALERAHKSVTPLGEAPSGAPRSGSA